MNSNYNGQQKKISAALSRGETINILYIDLTQLEVVEEKFGEYQARDMLDIFLELLKITIKKALSENTGRKNINLIDICQLWGDDFVVVLSSERDITLEMHNFGFKIQKELDDSFTANVPTFLKEYKGVRIGFADIKPPAINVDKQYNKALKKAYKMSRLEIIDLPSNLIAEYLTIVKRKNVQSYYQPIISLHNCETMGWEALVRGPDNSYFFNPHELFMAAKKTETLYDLEILARERQIMNVGEIAEQQKLFLNVNPVVLDAPGFNKGVTRNILQKFNLSPQQIVFEITERTAITNFRNFRKTVNHYRNQGYLIAVDDAGAGYSSLQAIAEIRPDFIKVDMSIIKDVDKSKVKKALLETFVEFTKKINCQIIAEGIETANELSVVTKLGVDFGQGFFIAKPNPCKLEPSQQSKKIILSIKPKSEISFSSLDEISVASVLEYIVEVDENLLVEKLAELFETEIELQGVVVINSNRKPMGYVLRQNLYKLLVTRYGAELYYRKPVTEIMNNRPMIVSVNTSLEEIAKKAMSRDTANIYDFIIVEENDKFAGIITIQNLLENMTKLKIEQAQHSNPLTKLPGNLLIEKQIEQKLKHEIANNFVVIYVDIDNFKPYNDTYGFENGDQLILLVAKILKHVAIKTKDIFVGHVGGDDFVVVCNLDKVEFFVSRVLKLYERLLPYRYNNNDWQAQVIAAEDRNGISCVYPLSTLSIAGLTLNNSLHTAKDVAERVASIKKKAKQISGNAWLLE